MHPYVLYELQRQRSADIARRAELHRLFADAQPPAPPKRRPRRLVLPRLRRHAGHTVHGDAVACR